MCAFPQRLPLEFGQYVGAQAAEQNSWKPKMGTRALQRCTPAVASQIRVQEGWHRTLAGTRLRRGCLRLCTAARAPLLTSSCSASCPTLPQSRRSCRAVPRPASATACASWPAPSRCFRSRTSIRCSQMAVSAAGEFCSLSLFYSVPC